MSGVNQHNPEVPLQPHQAQLAELPWVALLLNNSGGGALVVGGGSLVHPRVVLTSGTRVNSLPASDMVVTLGEWNRTSLSPVLQRQDHPVQEYVLHPRFNATSQENDMALIILKNAAVKAPNVQSICLARSFDQVDRTKCISGAWGIPHQATFDFVSIQKRIHIPIVDVERCTRLLRQTPLGPDFFLYDSFFCGGGVEGPGTCMGDEGSPLACPSFKDGRYMLVGTLSGGIQCGTQDVPDIYKSYMDSSYDWIKETIIQKFPLTSRSAEKTRNTPATQNSNVSESGTAAEPNLTNRNTTVSHTDLSSPSTDKGLNLHEVNISSGSDEKESNTRTSFDDSPTNAEASFDTKTLLGSFDKDGCSIYKHPGQLSASNGPLTPSQAEHGEFPWVALLQDAHGTLVGAGALVHPRAVVTAASYLTNRTKSDITVVLGEWNRRTGSEEHALQMLAPLDIVFHRNFNSTHNDIALILLQEEAKGAPHVQSVCLAQSLEEVDRSRCVVSGWGTLNPNSEHSESIQKRVLSPARPRAACEAELQQVLGPEFRLPDSFLCAGGTGGPSVCQVKQAVCATVIVVWVVRHRYKPVVQLSLLCGL
ncbi:Serine proteases trypsin domain [Trinorchestia longiramus]|nr:Serine proteases trypsin domain [Trinorchestia longiramus]